jgi:hypothetical protein
LRGDAPEFVPSGAIYDVLLEDGAKGENGEKEDTVGNHENGEQENRTENESQHAHSQSDEEGEDTILTQLPNVFREADKVGRAATVGAEDFVNENNNDDIDISHDPAGFVVKQISKKKRNGLLMKLNAKKLEED